MKEIKVRKDYSVGEASPYRDWATKQSNFKDEQEIVEPVEANPDILAENQGLWYREEASDELKALVSKVLTLLTPKQRKVIEMIGLEGKTVAHTAVVLNVSRQYIYKLLNQIKKRLSNLGFDGYK